MESLEFNPLYLTLGIIIGCILVIIKSISEYKKTKSKIMKENFSNVAKSPGFICCISEYIKRSSSIKELISKNVISSDLFIDQAKNLLSLSFYSDYNNHIEYIPDSTLENPLTYLYRFPYFSSYNLKFSCFKEALSTPEITSILLSLYINNILSNYSDLEKEEYEYKEFIKQFGQDSKNGEDLPLHNKEKIKEEIYNEDNPIDLDKLISMEVVEEFDDNLKEF